MEKTTTVLPFRQAASVDDPLSEIARDGARRMIAIAIQAEVDEFVAGFSDLKLPDGRPSGLCGMGMVPNVRSRPGSGR